MSLENPVDIKNIESSNDLKPKVYPSDTKLYFKYNFNGKK